MSTLTTDTTTTTAPRHSVSAAPRLSFHGVLRSEWVKLWSLRSNRALLGGAAAVMAVVGLLFSAFVGGLISGGGGGPGGALTAGPAAASLQGTTFAALVIGVFGVMVITAEYASGSIRSTLTMVPRRLPVLGAKILVVAVVSFVVMLATVFAVFLGGQALIGSGGVAAASLTDPGVLRAVIGTAAYLTAVALMGLAVGVLLRSTAGAISSLVGVLLLLPLVGSLVLPADWAANVTKYLPSNAGSALTSITSTPGLLSPTAGALVLAAWVVVPLVGAAVALRRRAA